jgi:hypothetical protein
MKKDYIVLKGADALYTNSRLKWNLQPNAFYRNMSQDGHDDIYMKLVSINFRIPTADNNAVDGSCLIDTNLSFGNLSPTSGHAILSIVETYLHTSTGGTQYVSPKQPQHDIRLKVSKFGTIQLGVLYDGAYINVSSNQNNFTAVLEIEYRDNNLKELM